MESFEETREECVAGGRSEEEREFGGNDFEGDSTADHRAGGRKTLIFRKEEWQKRHKSVQVKLPLSDEVLKANFCDVPCKTEKAVQFSAPPQKEKEVQTDQGGKALDIENMSTKQIHSFCGVDLKVLNFIVFKVRETLTDSRLLQKKAKVMLMLIRFKLNVPFSTLAAFFNVSESTAQSAFQESLSCVYEVAKDNLIWFEKSEIKKRMPPAFRALFPHTRVIIDCSEIKIERPANLRQRVLTYSNYKSDYTVKFLLGIAPSGETMFVSKTYGGRATDTEITCNSGFLELLEEGDVVLADKGFPRIENNVLEKGGILVLPPFKSGNRQFSHAENEEGYKCACVRVHVERAIARLKVFKILKFVTTQNLKHIDEIVTIICFLQNLSTDLIKAK